MQQVKLAALGIPNQRLAAVTDVRQQARHGVDYRSRRLGVKPIERLPGALEVGGRLAVNLPAPARRFVNHDWFEAMPHKSLGRPNPGRAGADYDRLQISLHPVSQAGLAAHAGLKQRGASAQLRARFSQHPAVLAGPHQAKPGALFATGFGLPELPALRQYGGHDGIAVQCFAWLPVQGKAQPSTAGLGQALELALGDSGLHFPPTNILSSP